MQSGRNESNFVFTLARSAAPEHRRGILPRPAKAPDAGLEHRSLKELDPCSSKRTPLIAEIKFTSPAEGKLRPAGDVKKIAKAYERGGVSGISVLTEPKHFDGDIRYLPLVKKAVKVPVLMKDIIIDPVQIDAGAKMGADAVLFIAAIFANGLARASLEEMFARAHDGGLEVLFEAHTEEEYIARPRVRSRRGRDKQQEPGHPGGLPLDLEEAAGRGQGDEGATQEDREGQARDIGERHQARDGRSTSSGELGADGFLIGSAFMKSADLEAKVRSLTGASR